MVRNVLLACLLSAVLPAQDLRSGPDAGTPLPPVGVYAAAGSRAGEEFDVAAWIGTRPGALLFVHEISRNVAPLIRGFDRLAAELAVLGFRGGIVRLDDDRTRAEERTRTVSQALSLAEPMLVSLDGAEGPGDLALNRKCTLTLVTVRDGAVVAARAYTDTGRQDLDALREALQDVAGALPSDPRALRARLLEQLPDDAVELKQRLVALALALRAQQAAEARGAQGRDRRAMRQQPMREAGDARADESRPPRAERRGQPPTDEQLRGLLRGVIRKDNDVERNAELFAAVDARVGDDAGLREQARQMFELMLSLSYGTEDAQRRARAWLDAHKR